MQIFTPTPSTYASVMYHTGIDPFSGEKLFIEKEIAGKLRQKSVVTDKNTSAALPHSRAKPRKTPLIARNSSSFCMKTVQKTVYAILI